MCLCCIGWAKPVPVEVRNCRKVRARTALALTALAGPVSNILMAYVFMIITKLVICFAPASEVLLYVVFGMEYVITISIYLGIFNLIPIPPFDGYKIAYSFLPAKVTTFMDRNAQYIHWTFFALLIFGLLDKPLDFLTGCVWWLLDLASFFIPLG